MNEYVEILKRHIAENPPNYGSDANSILEMLFSYYHECNNTDTDAVKAAFEDLYQRMHDMPLREMDRIVDAVCTLCREHEKAGFVEDVKVGLGLAAWGGNTIIFKLSGNMTQSFPGHEHSVDPPYNFCCSGRT